MDFRIEPMKLTKAEKAILIKDLVETFLLSTIVSLIICFPMIAMEAQIWPVGLFCVQYNLLYASFRLYKLWLSNSGR